MAQKEWTPRFQGDAPPDWDGKPAEVWFEIREEWGYTESPRWVADVSYRYTPKPEQVSPSDRAKEVARKLAGLEPGNVGSAARAYRDAFARFIEERAPELLPDPLEEILRDVLLGGAHLSKVAAELRKRGVKLEGEP
jgi:hypothetical protein